MEPQSIWTTQHHIKQLVEIFCQSGAVNALPQAIQLYLDSANRVENVAVEVDPSKVYSFEKVRVENVG